MPQGTVAFASVTSHVRSLSERPCLPPYHNTALRATPRWHLQTGTRVATVQPIIVRGADGAREHSDTLPALLQGNGVYQPTHLQQAHQWRLNIALQCVGLRNHVRSSSLFTPHPISHKYTVHICIRIYATG